jgi:hypothetical protein
VPNVARAVLVRASGFAAALVVALGAAAIAAPGAWWSPATATGCAAAATESHAGLVVDFGTVSGAGTPPASTPEVDCVAFSRSTESGSQLLVDAHHTLSFNDVGLLCSIDGYPASGCTSGADGVYRYWSYWHGGPSWTYASTGPDFYQVAPGGVDGWRFVAGRDSASENPPRAAASGPCRAVTTTTIGSGGSPTTTVRPYATKFSGGVAPPDTATGAGVTSTSSAVRGSSTTATHSTRSTSPPETLGGVSASSNRALAAAAPVHHASSDGSPVGALAVVALIVVLGAAALVVSRARAAP